MKDEVLRLDALPEGWIPIKGALTAPRGWYWASNGKSRFTKEFRHALIREADRKEEGNGHD